MYLSGINAQKESKLLRIPEWYSERGVDEFELVRDYLKKWQIKIKIVGMVFDTTYSTSGENAGACYYLEAWVDKLLLLLSCRDHMAEQNLGAAVKVITGDTKEHKVYLFCCLREEWHNLDIDLTNLELFDYSFVSYNLQKGQGGAIMGEEFTMEKHIVYHQLQRETSGRSDD